MAREPNIITGENNLMYRKSFNARHTSGSSRFGSGNNRRPGASSSGRQGRGRYVAKTEEINFSRFINKAQETEVPKAYVPENNFCDFQIEDVLKTSIIRKGYDKPTPIQDKAMPELLKGKDVVGTANTGTGKTAAFLIPLLSKVLRNKREQVMIIVPTRELALQIDEELRAFAQGLRIYSVCCVGGAPINKQINQLRYQYNFVIGTPGRIKDLIERKNIFPSEFQSIVLDEADRMLDMGFVADMRSIMNAMPRTRQTLFFSATINRDIEKLIGEFLKDPVRISVKTQDTAININQEVLYVDRMKGKLETLHDLLIQKDKTKVLVFGRTKHGVEKLSKDLIKRGFKAESIHGNKSTNGRQRALQYFKNGNAQILVATDVAARGLDIPDVSHVINYDMPATNDDYIHRIGRTGRGIKNGKAITLVEL
jgi:superfamily II DNA/RNA helicase